MKKNITIGVLVLLLIVEFIVLTKHLVLTKTVLQERQECEADGGLLDVTTYSEHDSKITCKIPTKELWKRYY